VTAVQHRVGALMATERYRRAALAAAGLLLAAAVLALLAASPARGGTAGVQSTTLGTPGVTFGFQEPINSLLTIGDAADEQLAFVTPLATVPSEALAKTAWMNLGKPGVDKEFLDFIWNAVGAKSAAYILSYSVDGQAWLNAGSSGAYQLPDSTHGKTIAIRVWMTTSDPNATPRFDDLTIEWTKWKGKPTKPAGDGSGPSHKPNAGHNNGSGVYTYPSVGKTPAQAPASGTGGSGSSAGAGGTSSGASGSGNGSGVAAATANTAPAAAAPAPAGEVPAPPVMSSGEGAPTAVTGVLSNQGQQVSGVPYVPSSEGGAAGSGGTPPGGARGGVNVPLLLISIIVVVLGVVLFTPWLFAAASLRRITGYDEKRARAGGPFSPARRPKLF
jgi:hypothetical protein